LIGAYSIGPEETQQSKQEEEGRPKYTVTVVATGIFAKRNNFTNVNNAQFRTSKVFLLNFYN
jgi:hypothetical protein